MSGFKSGSIGNKSVMQTVKINESDTGCNSIEGSMDENIKMEISTRQGARTGMSIGQRVDNEDLDKTGTFGA